MAICRWVFALALLFGMTACRSTDLSSTQISTSSGAVRLTTIFSFSGPDGQAPIGLLQATDGHLYGVTAQGGTYGPGTVFRVTPEGSLTTLVHFNAQTNGYNPDAMVIQGQDGHFYGTTSGGGNQGRGFGTVFRVTAQGEFTTLVVFDRDTGVRPTTRLVQTPTGDLYGTTAQGGQEEEGTLFRLTPDGITTLVELNVSDHPGPSEFLQGQDGNFYVMFANIYGTEYGDGGEATLLKVTPTGAVTTLTTFAPHSRESFPSDLIQGRDRNFYGITAGNGDQPGILFRVTPEGQKTTLVQFPAGLYPSSVIQATDGNLYGTAIGNHETTFGSIFRVTPKGDFTQWPIFEGKNGSAPTSLIQTQDGEFYGTTASGGTADKGTLFKLTFLPQG